MKRKLVAIGLVVFGLVLYAFVAVTTAAPGGAPLLQITESEPNDDFASAGSLPVPGYVYGVVDEVDTVDYFSMTTQINRYYQADLSLLDSTGDLAIAMRLYDGYQDYVQYHSTTMVWLAYTTTYYIRVEALLSSSITTTQSAEYRLDVNQLAETPTPTATKTPTPTPTYTPSPTPTNTPKPTPTFTPPPGVNPGTDQFEPNWDFDTAFILDLGVTYEANFIPYVGTDDDNDFYRVWVKPGLLFTCEVVKMDPGMDPNIIWYNKDRVAISGNDDKELGDYRSYFSYYSTWEGWMYVLIGHGGRMSPADVQNSKYSIHCDKEVPGLPDTPTPGPTRTPAPTRVPDTPTNTPVPPPDITVRPQSTPALPSPDTPVSRFIPIRVVIYYDGNGDGQFGAGEGIAGVSGRADEATTGQLLAQGFSNAQGELEFTVSTQGPVLVSVPFFGFSQLVAGEESTIYLRVPPSSY